MQDPYEVLGVTPQASPDELRAAFRRLARRHHPDRVAGESAAVRKAAHDRMAALTAAYHVLTDPAAEAQYRRVRAVARAAAPRVEPGDPRARARAAFERQQRTVPHGGVRPTRQEHADAHDAPTAGPRSVPEADRWTLSAWVRAWLRGDTRRPPAA